MALVPVVNKDGNDWNDRVFENVDEMLDFLKKKNIEPSSLKTVAGHLKEMRKKQEEIQHQCDEYERLIEPLKQLLSRDSSRYEQIHSERDQVGLELLARRKERENLVKSFIELKGKYEETIAKQYSIYIIEGQVKFQQQSSRTTNEADPQSKDLNDQIRQVDDEIASLEQELARKNDSVLDLENKLEQLKKSVNESQLVAAATPMEISNVGNDDDGKFGFQLLPD